MWVSGTELRKKEEDPSEAVTADSSNTKAEDEESEPTKAENDKTEVEEIAKTGEENGKPALALTPEEPMICEDTHTVSG